MGIWIHRQGSGFYLKMFVALFVGVGVAMIAFFIKPTDVDPRFGLGVGALCGAALAPRLRKVLTEEWMLGGALAVTAVAGTLSALVGGLKGAAMITGGVALVSGSAKLAFDSLVQRDAPNADHGRAFAANEARFQLLWVVGALCGVLVPFPLRLGFATVAAAAVVCGTSFVLGRRAIAAGSAPPKLSEVVRRAMSEPVPTPSPSAPSLMNPVPRPSRQDWLEPTQQLPVIPPPRAPVLYDELTASAEQPTDTPSRRPDPGDGDFGHVDFGDVDPDPDPTSVMPAFPPSSGSVDAGSHSSSGS